MNTTEPNRPDEFPIADQEAAASRAWVEMGCVKMADRAARRSTEIAREPVDLSLMDLIRSIGYARAKRWIPSGSGIASASMIHRGSVAVQIPTAFYTNGFLGEIVVCGAIERLVIQIPPSVVLALAEAYKTPGFTVATAIAPAAAFEPMPTTRRRRPMLRKSRVKTAAIAAMFEQGGGRFRLVASWKIGGPRDA